MTGRHSVTILHVSDMQFGKEHRFGTEGITEGDRKCSSLAARLLDDLAWLQGEHELRPDLVVASGDLTEWALPTEFTKVNEFLTEVAEGLGLGNDRVAMVPGNHDISWKKCRAYFDDCAGDEINPVPPYWPKWMPFFRMFSQFYIGIPGIEFPKDQPWSLFEMPELNTVVAGLNSTMAESHRDPDHYGFCGEEQLRWFADRLRAYAGRGWLRIGVMHHNPVIVDPEDDAFLRDRHHFGELVAPHLNLLLHGHTHEGRIDSYGADALAVLCAGSTGVREAARPDEVPNQYQLVEVTPGGLQVYARRYNASRRRWEGDTGIGIGRDQATRRLKRSFDDCHATFPSLASRDDERDEEADPRTRRSPDVHRDDLLTRVRQVCRVRHPEADVKEIRSGDRRSGYLRVTVPSEPQVSMYPIGVCEGPPGREVMESFLSEVDARYRAGDPHLTSYFVYDGEAVPEELRTWSGMRGVRLQRLMEFQGVPDLQPYADKQAERLAGSQVYPSELYVPQRFSVADGRGPGQARPGLLERLREWIADHDGRFVVVLGDFGHGKTFLLRELTRLIHREGVPPVIPILIQLRDLEKAHTLDELLAAHLTAGGEEVIDHRLLRYLIHEGRVLLLFDGFDELALRVTYERAAEHLGTLVQAAQGRAKVVLTSRTQYFLSDRDVETALSGRLATVPGRRLVRLHEFDDAQILAFLTRLLGGDEAGARARLELLRDVQDLLGLSRNPRMLGFISRLDENRLRRIRDRKGTISAAVLYRELLERWLEFEYDRARPKGTMPSLPVTDRWTAVQALALELWNTGQETLGLDALGTVAETLRSLAELRLTPGQASHVIGSGTLLVRPESGRFAFVHRSVMEWLVADRIAGRLKEGERNPPELLVRALSELMADFVAELAGRSTVTAWAQASLAAGTDTTTRTAKQNALTLLRRLNAPLRSGDGDRPRVRLSGMNLRGADLTGADLRDADLSGADLREARLDGADLTGADLRDAVLRESSGRKARLDGADLRRADFSLARFFDAGLTGARFEGSRWVRTVLLGAVLTPGRLDGCDTRGAALPSRFVPSHESAPSHDSLLHSLAWSPGGDILAFGGSSHRIHLWDPAAGTLIRTLQGHTGGVNTLAWSPDGTRLATAGDDATVRVWDPATGALVRALEGHTDWVRSVSWSPDGTRLATAGDDATVRVWDPATGARIRAVHIHPGRVNVLAWSPDGAHLATAGNDATAHLWDPATGALVRTLEGHPGRVNTLTWSPDGAHLATAGNDATVRVWDPATGTLVRTLEGHADWINSVSWSPDGIHLATAGNDATVRVWDPATGTLVRTLEGHPGRVNTLAWSPGAIHLATIGNDAIIRVWDPATGTLVRTLEGRTRWTGSVAWSPDGTRLATGGDDATVHLWDPATGTRTRTLEGHTDWIRSVAWSPDAARLATGGDDATVHLWDPATGTRTRTLEGHTGGVNALAWSPDGTHLASADGDAIIRVWDPSTGLRSRVLKGHDGGVNALAWNPDGTCLATGSDDTTVRIWDHTTGVVARTVEGRTGGVNALAWSPDGTRLATGGDDVTVHLWDPATGTRTRTLEGHTDWVRSVSWSPDGTRLATAGDDATVRVWDPATGTLVRTLEGHTHWIRSISWSPDGTRLATAGHDATVRVWDPATGAHLASLLALPDGSAAFGPDGLVHKLSGTPTGVFWWAVNLCTFSAEELAPYVSGLRRVPYDSPLSALLPRPEDR
ncbi:eIF2A-related protein [Streptosporangium longisporum]|uniref:NACHT domain-containing protein n=1 Tax=Streptosporangium longisporum TaxID=46187 RepID=A0ABP6L2V2_9ACTN